MTLLQRVFQRLAALAGQPTETGESDQERPEESFHWTGTNVSPITAAQVRMARAGLGWGVRELADKAGLTARTITRFENGSDAKAATIGAIRSALQSAGIEFIAEQGQGIGVKLRTPARPDGGET